MHPHIFRLDIAIDGMLGIDKVSAVRIKMMHILPLGYFILKENDLIVAHLIKDPINSRTGIKTRESIKMTVFVSPFKNQIPELLVFHMVLRKISRMRQPNGIVHAVILGHHHPNLIRILHVDIGRIHINVQLLIPSVELNIRITAHPSVQFHHRFDYAEINLRNLLISVSILIDGNPVITA